jgi:HEAT repeat protein
MDEKTRTSLEAIHRQDRERQNEAFVALLEASEQPVDWAYGAWDELLAGLRDPDNHVRAIAAQILCNLAARSDPERRLLRDFDALLAVTKDERFVTARHCLQALWKIGVAGKEQQRIVVEGLSRRFAECGVEKNGTLIRYDIIQDLRNLFDAVQDEPIREQALALIETEADLKYRKKYASVWKRK